VAAQVLLIVATLVIATGIYVFFRRMQKLQEQQFFQLQQLTALRMVTTMLRMRYQDISPEFNDHIQRMKEAIDSCIVSVREVASSLRPAVLDMGLIASVDWLLNNFNTRTGIATQLRAPNEDLQLDDARATAVFRVLPESLTNNEPHRLTWIFRIKIMIRLLIADDHAVVRQGLSRVVAIAEDMELVAEAKDGDELLRHLAKGDVEMVLTDMNMPGLGGTELIKAIRNRYPRLPVLVFSMHSESQIASQAIKAGAQGYITKDSEPEILLAAIRRCAQGNHYISADLASDLLFNQSRGDEEAPHSKLSEREMQIFLLLAAGKHMTLKRSDNHYFVDVSPGPPVNRHCPSVDVLYRSVARAAGAHALGIILTGMGDDGARGMKELFDTGATTLAQNEASCVVYGMPKEAVSLGGVTRSISLQSMPAAILGYAKG
jgi:chemotaxis response regulator CheB